MAVTLKLTGEDGNAFSVIGRAGLAFRKAGASPEDRDKFVKEAMSGDYNHLLATVMGYADKFGVEVE